MLCFRDRAEHVSSERFVHDLLGRLSAARSNPAALLSTLLRVGELEAALEDSEHRAAALARQLSDDAAQGWLARSAKPLTRWLDSGLSLLGLPEQLRLVRPEGYAYYALNPAAYAQVLGARHEQGRPVAVVGIRSIGTSLSAVVRATLARRGVRSERITVRPHGHPWDRRLDLGERLELFVRRWQSALFLVVDEGPGLSGSTFLAVGEALERAGIAPERIEFTTSGTPDPSQMVARDAARRWSRFRATPVPGPPVPAAATNLSAGAWRAHVYAAESEWPACDAALERHKYRTASGALVKFIGLPPYDEAPLARGQLLADAGYCPAIERRDGGYAEHRWIDGQPLRSPVLSPRAAPRLLDYLVFRSRECRVGGAPLAELNRMLQVNVQEALGIELPASQLLVLECPVYADGRLAPEKWIASRDGTLVKVDATDHGDDHLLPGPCDSAWDIAGAIIEWQLTPARAQELCDGYRQRTGDPVAARLQPYLLAYAALRVGRTRMAALSASPAERLRLERAGQYYLHALRCLAGAKRGLEVPRAHHRLPVGQTDPHGTG
jgi:hypothetical protein